MQVKLNQLRDVVAIAERGSLRGASRQLGIAQPVLTRSIQDLERKLGTTLFERRTQGVSLTPTGEIFIRRARSVLGEVRRAEEEIEQVHGRTSGTVIAAMSAVPHFAVLPRILAPFRRRYPDLSLKLVEGVYPTVEDQLRNGGVDFYIGPRPERAVARDLLVEHLFDNERIILARKDHPFLAAQNLSNLQDAAWATTSITTNAEGELNELFSAHGLRPPNLRVRTQSALSLLITIAYSDVLAMVPVQWTSFAQFDNSLTAIRVAEPLPGAQIVVVRRAGLPMTPAAEHFLDLVRDCKRDPQG